MEIERNLKEGGSGIFQNSTPQSVAVAKENARNAGSCSFTTAIEPVVASACWELQFCNSYGAGVCQCMLRVAALQQLESQMLPVHAESCSFATGCP